MRGESGRGGVESRSEDVIIVIGGKANAAGWESRRGLQGGLDPNKISDLGADFGIIVR